MNLLLDRAISKMNKNLRGTGYSLINTSIPGVFLFKKMPTSNDVPGLLALFHLSHYFDLVVYSDEGLQLLMISGDEFPTNVSYQALSMTAGYGHELLKKLTLSNEEFHRLKKKANGAEMIVYCIYRNKGGLLNGKRKD